MQTIREADPVSTAEKARVRQFNRNKWFFSIGGIGRDMSYTLVSTFLLTYLQFGVSMTLAQFTTLALLIGVLGRVWDGLNDPLMGSLIENTHFRWGKFKPWIFIGAVLTGVFILAMFLVRSITGWWFVAYLIVVYLLWEASFTMNDIGYWSMLPSLTSVKSERDQLSMLTVAFAAIGAILANAVFSLFSAGNVVKTYSMWSVIIVLIFIALQAMTAFCCKETPRPQTTEKNKGISIRQIFSALRKNDQALWMALALLTYYISNGLLITLAYNLYYVEVGYDGNVFWFVAIYGIANVSANFFYPLFARRFSRRRILTVAAIVAMIGYACIFCLGWFSFLPFSLLTFSVFGLFVFFSTTIFYMATVVNYTNCVEYNEYITGERNEALISTLRPFVAKLSDATKYGIQILVLVLSGVYLLSQNISGIETQKNFLAGIENTRDQIAYVERVKSYITRAEAGEDSHVLQSALDEDEVLKNYQIRAENLTAIGDCHLFRYENADGKQTGETDLGKIAALDAARLTEADGETAYSYQLMISGEGFNAGNDNFKDKIGIGPRLALRVAVCILPILFLAVALWVQRHKFIIDEEKYEQIVSELEARHAAASPVTLAGGDMMDTEH